MLTLAEICRINKQTHLLSLKNLKARRLRSHCEATSVWLASEQFILHAIVVLCLTS